MATNLKFGEELKTLQRNEYVFTILKQHLSKRIGLTMLEDFEVRDWMDHELQALCVEFSAGAMAMQIHEDTADTYSRYKIPKTWWQHWKQDKAPEWFKKRYPTKYENHTIKNTAKFTRYATYPMANYHLPKERRKISFEWLGRPEIIKDVVSEEQVSDLAEPEQGEKG